jgi:predicted GNAT family N-acyltransferase
MKNNLKVEIVKWIDSHAQLKNIREKVFIQEQKVTPELEWDGMDENAMHFLVFKDEEAIGCARAVL